MPNKFINMDCISNAKSAFFKNTLYKNSIFLAFDSYLINILGFLFLSIITHIYAPSEIGSYSAIISVTGLLALFSRMGFDVGLIRFLNESNNRKDLINTCITICSVLIIILSLIYLNKIEFLSPTLTFMATDYTLIILFMAAGLFLLNSTLQTNIFIALKSSQYLMIRDILSNGVRIIFVVIMAKYGIIGLTGAYVLGVLSSVIITSFLLIPKIEPKYFPKPTLNKTIIKEIVAYSMGNYSASMFGTLSIYLLPLMVVNTLGVESAAYFYVSWSIAQVIFVLSGSISTSFFAEGASARSGNNYYKMSLKPLKLEFIILGIICILTILFSGKLLFIFGKTYSINSVMLLWLFAISALPSSFNEILINIKRIEKNIKCVNFYNGLMMLSIIIFCYIFMLKFGINGIGLGYLFAQSMIAIVILRLNISSFLN